jgi:hypothetical protein
MTYVAVPNTYQVRPIFCTIRPHVQGIGSRGINLYLGIGFETNLYLRVGFESCQNMYNVK